MVLFFRNRAAFKGVEKQGRTLHGYRFDGDLPITVQSPAIRRLDMEKRFAEDKIIGFLREAEAGWQ